MSTAPDPTTGMTPAQVEMMMQRVAEAAAEKAIRQTFASLGIDPASSAQIRDFHADMSWVRNAREGSSRLTTTAKGTIMTSLVTAVLFAIWQIFERTP